MNGLVRKMTKEVVEALFYPILKYPKEKLGNNQWGDPDYTRNPTMKIKIPYWEVRGIQRFMI